MFKQTKEMISDTEKEMQPWKSDKKKSTEWWMRPLNLQNHAKHASCFVVITSVLPHSITNVFTRTRKGSYRFFQLNPQTILKKQLNGLAHNCAVFLFLSLIVVSQLFSSCLETFFNFFFRLEKYHSVGRVIDGGKWKSRFPLTNRNVYKSIYTHHRYKLLISL